MLALHLLLSLRFERHLLSSLVMYTKLSLIMKCTAARKVHQIIGRRICSFLWVVRFHFWLPYRKKVHFQWNLFAEIHKSLVILRKFHLHSHNSLRWLKPIPKSYEQLLRGWAARLTGEAIFSLQQLSTWHSRCDCLIKIQLKNLVPGKPRSYH